MVILTIKFPKGTKTYDYLMDNTEGVKIDKNKPLRLIIGANKYGISTQNVCIIDGRKVDSLPPHVTSKLILHKDNLAQTANINAELIKKLGTVKKVVTVNSGEHKYHVLDNLISWSINNLEFFKKHKGGK